LKSKELIASSEHIEANLEDLVKRIDVGADVDAYEGKAYFVNRAVKDGLIVDHNVGLLRRSFYGKTVDFDLALNSPPPINPSYAQLKKTDAVFLLWTYYRDGYGVGRAHSNIGTYMSLGNFSAAFRNFTEAISTLSHAPQGFNSFDSTAQLRKESALLRKGVKMYTCKDERDVDAQGFLGIAKTDSQELVKYLNHSSLSSHGCCPHCQVHIYIYTCIYI
jgi:hypothetical protein